MSASVGFKWVLAILFALVTANAEAGRRGLRVDGFGDSWTTYDGQNTDPPGIGTANCPGTTSGSTAADTLILNVGFTFSGLESTAYLVDDYCQVANAGTLTSTNYFYSDETGLATLFGDNSDNAITGIRYAFLDQDRFSSPTGFQWGFYTFPGNVTLVALYGLESVTLDNTSYISGGVWSGQNGYSGEYFCFKNGVFIGTWNGDLTDTSVPCLQAAGVVFINGFE